MSLIRCFEHLGEECVVCFPSEGDERLYMPLCGAIFSAEHAFLRNAQIFFPNFGMRYGKCNFQSHI